jgi:hypothetical protein
MGQDAEPSVAAQTRDAGRRWKPLDVALLAGIVVLVGAFIAAVVIAVATPTLAAPSLPRWEVGERLAPGDCVSSFDRTAGGFGEFEVVSCDTPHAAQLIYVAELVGQHDAFLGPEAARELAGSICKATFDFGIHLRDLKEHPTAMLFGVYEGRAYWEGGAADYQCFLINSDGSPFDRSYFDDELTN